MSTNLLFFHGREGSSHGKKAQWLAQNYGAFAPSYPTQTMPMAMAVAREILEEHKPNAIVGSSFGGAVLLQLIQEGLWDGPSIFLAQAGVKFGLPVELPASIPAVLIHGARDTIVGLEDSRRLAESGNAELVVVNDGHRLDSIRESGVLLQALKSVGVYPLEPTKKGDSSRRELDA